LDRLSFFNSINIKKRRDGMALWNKINASVEVPVYPDREALIESMDKKEAIEVIEDFITTMKNTYPQIAYGEYSQGFCTAERDQDKDTMDILTKDKKPSKRYICWPSCNQCAFEIIDGYGLLEKALDIIKSPAPLDEIAKTKPAITLNKEE